jgi:SAM-dependent methyltransferase
MTLTLRQLPIESPTPPDGGGSDEFAAMQALTRKLAVDPDSWTPERLVRITALFDGLAPEWHTRDTEERLGPIRGALQRGGVPPGGLCAEIGSGTGLQTPLLLQHFGFVISTDLSGEMLARSPRRSSVALVRSDAFRLPLASASVDAVVAVNMFLIPAEYARVLRAGGRFVFVSVIGAQTPIYVSPAEVVRALEPVLRVSDAVTSGDGRGIWTVVTKGDS